MIVEAIKHCARCSQNKPISQFYAASAAVYGARRSSCKTCSLAQSKAYRAANKLRPPDRAGAIKECIRCGGVFPTSDFHKDAGSTDGLYRYCKACGVIHARACRYGLTRVRVREMLEQTACEACGKHLPTNSEKYIDHRHSDGAVRGILCDRCNTTLGMCEENLAIFAALSAYLANTACVDYRTQPYVKQNCTVLDISSPDQQSPAGLGRTCQTNTPSQ